MASSMEPCPGEGWHHLHKGSDQKRSEGVTLVHFKSESYESKGDQEFWMVSLIHRIKNPKDVGPGYAIYNFRPILEFYF